ncbi:MAG: class I tRNA ligase family protein, partial [Patescibacteria group bacterium]
TRGWFYTLLAVATLLGKKASYKNVLTLELVLDEKGKKMSKSRGNVVEPNALIEKYGADAARWYFFTVNQPWDPKLFFEKDVARSRNALALFWNSFLFFKTYNKNSKFKIQNSKFLNILDKWILARLNEVARIITEKLDHYDIVDAARLLEAFIGDDLSRWYIRRSRERFKKEGKDADEAAQTLGFILRETAKLLAPFAPFISEAVYQGLEGEKKSVHLENWFTPPRPRQSGRRAPFVRGGNKEYDILLKEMDEVREIVAQALEARAKAGIKIRQPLASLKIKRQKSKIKNNEELSDLIGEEVNVRKVIFDEHTKEDVEIDTNITPELKEEGEIRELIRLIQDARKKAGLKSGEKASLEIKIPVDLVETAKRNKKQLMYETKTEF